MIPYWYINIQIIQKKLKKFCIVQTQISISPLVLQIIKSHIYLSCILLYTLFILLHFFLYIEELLCMMISRFIYTTIFLFFVYTLICLELFIVPENIYFLCFFFAGLGLLVNDDAFECNGFFDFFASKDPSFDPHPPKPTPPNPRKESTPFSTLLWPKPNESYSSKIIEMEYFFMKREIMFYRIVFPRIWTEEIWEPFFYIFPLFGGLIDCSFFGRSGGGWFLWTFGLSHEDDNLDVWNEIFWRFISKAPNISF